MKISRRHSKLKKPVISQNTATVDEAKGQNREEILPSELETKFALFQPYLERNQDLVCRRLQVAALNLSAVIFYLEGMVDGTALNQDVIRPLLKMPREERNHDQNPIEEISEHFLSVGQIRVENTLQKVLDDIFAGFTVVMVEGNSEVLVIDIRGGAQRAISEPLLDGTLCGPREGFNENIIINLNLIRRKLRDSNLVVHKRIIGKRSHTAIAVLYIEDIADPNIVNEVNHRIEGINIDAVLSTGYINQLIEDEPYTVFPLKRMCERPDIAVADLLEGRVVILCDQAPLAIIYPALFGEMFQAAEDYYEKVMLGSIWRWFRFLAFIIAVSLPAAYIALLSFQPELIPFNLLVSLAQARKEVPFPVVIETIIMTFIIQMVIEAGIRLPSPLGQTIGVVSGIILGQAAITAKLASPAMIMVVAITTISSFMIPNFCMVMAARVLQIPMILLSATFGLFGFSMGWLLILGHLTGLESMGVPYLAPFAPTRYADLKDSLFRSFLWKLKQRPVSIPNQNPVRQGNMSKGRKD